IVQFGVPYTKFGTAYFPYSTLGENFGRLHMPGMSQEGYWPLAADTVKQWNLFADDIRRDLRIAKAMGFESIRLHHLEMLEPLDRLRRLGVKFDRVGEHAYQDSLDAIPSGRDFALAASDYGTEIGKPPVITEWNWRGLTRLTPEARAKVYPPIFENVLATRCM